MLVQKITRLSINGSNAEYYEIVPNTAWVVVFHRIDFDLKGSIYAGTKVCTSEQEAYEEAKTWLELRQLENEVYDI